MSTRAVHQPRSAKRKHIWPHGISTTISIAKGHLAQQVMMGVYPHSVITHQQSENTTSCGRISTTSRKAPQAQPRPRFLSNAKIQLAQPHMNNEQQSESASGRHSRVDQSGIVTAIIRAKAYMVWPYIHGDQQSKSTSGTAGHDGHVSPRRHNQSAKRKYN